MRVSVVGGGYTGCMAAMIASRMGCEVTLLEAGLELGGVLRDVEIQGKRFYNGCQYLRPASIEQAGLRSVVDAFSHEYGALTRLTPDETRLDNDCAQPAFSGVARLQTKPVTDGTALERLKSYGGHANALIEWASRIGELDQLNWRCLVPLQVSRIHFPEDSGVAALKQNDACADTLLAISRRARAPGSPIESAMLPCSGYNRLFDHIARALLDQGVRIELNAPVKVVQDQEEVRIVVRGRQHNPDWVVWASNPVPLLRGLLGVRLTTPPIPMRLLLGEWTEPFSPQVPVPYYWQIFDRESPITRVFLYELEGRLRYSVEAFGQGVHEEHAWRGLENVFATIGLPSGHMRVGTVRQNRHVNFSTREFEAIQSSTSSLIHRGILPGGWSHYGREEKVREIDEALRRALEEETSP